MGGEMYFWGEELESEAKQLTLLSCPSVINADQRGPETCDFTRNRRQQRKHQHLRLQSRNKSTYCSHRHEAVMLTQSTHKKTLKWKNRILTHWVLSTYGQCIRKAVVLQTKLASSVYANTTCIYYSRMWWGRKQYEMLILWAKTVNTKCIYSLREGGRKGKCVIVLLIACLQADFLYLHASAVLVAVFCFCKEHYI